jgi:hypothetical protein
VWVTSGGSINSPSINSPSYEGLYGSINSRSEEEEEEDMSMTFVATVSVLWIGAGAVHAYSCTPVLLYSCTPPDCTNTTTVLAIL